ncbi:MAG TPA: ribosome biogenesis factor YjgA [Gammaproteobacteria bacterium]|nr:ribosome biogenesis factor YjgA [Gammaproteobacteria bacterium]
MQQKKANVIAAAKLTPIKRIQSMINPIQNKEERVSKSERKRQMLALQKMGEMLVTLSSSQLEKIPLDPTLARAIQEARTLTTHEAKRRQLQYIGRLMRDIDPEPIKIALDQFELKKGQSKAQLHQIERWRDRLIAEDDQVLQSFLNEFPDVDHQHLRQLIRNAKKGARGADTALFRYLRPVIEK